MSDELHKLALDVRERIRYLSEIGVDSMSVDLPEIVVGAAVEQEVPRASLQPAPPAVRDTRDAEPKKERPKPGSRLAALPSLSNRKTIPFFDKYNPADGPPAGRVDQVGELGAGADRHP